MKIIFSRKGFDSQAGGVPSPLLPDGRMLSLPIPIKGSQIHYKSISWNGYNVGNIVSDLTNGKISADFDAHVDPDLDPQSLLRNKGWKPIFGQVGAAQGHLKNQSVERGDVFLFFGLFREVAIDHGTFRFKADTHPVHVIWGWLRVDEIVLVDTCNRDRLKWAQYHPHFHRDPDATNTVYVSKEYFNSKNDGVKGAGVFTHFSPELQLTAETSRKPSLWQLPAWFYPSADKPVLTYHGKLNRWERRSDCVMLNSVARGQEFVLDCNYYPESMGWLMNLLKSQDG